VPAFSASRRRFLQGVSAAGLTIPAAALLYGSSPFALAAPGARKGGETGGGVVGGGAVPESWLDVKKAGAVGDGKTIDSNVINKAIDHIVSKGGGVLHFPAGTYACYTIRLKSRVSLHLDPGATILAASVPLEGLATGGYDAAEPQGPWEPYQDFGHNHWRNSLIWGDGLHDIAIFGRGLIWGKGLSRGLQADADLPAAEKPGVANKAIALKNCRNVLLRDFSVLQGGWFALLATGVDNLTIDNVLVDTNRDGFDIDCCRNVRVSNCTVNSPWDDGICPKSSFALGYARASENITISDCYLTGSYELGSVLEGTWKPMPPEFAAHGTGRIKCGTESNGGFKNITIANCVFDQCRGIALETVDGANCEDITITGISMRGGRHCPLFMRLGRRMRGPAGAPVGTLKRVIISNITSSNSSTLPSIIAGLADHPVEDVKISDVFLQQVGGGSAELARRQPPEEEARYPEPIMFGELPATGFFIRHARNVEMSNIEITTAAADARCAFWLQDVDGADFFRVRVPSGPAYVLDQVAKFRSFGSRGIADVSFEERQSRSI
jgi:polygalacturonase